MLDKIYQYSYNLLKLIHSFDKSQWVLWQVFPKAGNTCAHRCIFCNRENKPWF
jgi:hypothetical protein